MRISLRVQLMLAAVAISAIAYERLSTQNVMMSAAKAYLAALTSEQKARGTFAFTADERLNWHFVPPEPFTYTPKERKGVALREMSSDQKHLAEALLSAGLSQQGIIKAHT